MKKLLLGIGSFAAAAAPVAAVVACGDDDNKNTLGIKSEFSAKDQIGTVGWNGLKAKPETTTYTRFRIVAEEGTAARDAIVKLIGAADWDAVLAPSGDAKLDHLQTSLVDFLKNNAKYSGSAVATTQATLEHTHDTGITVGLFHYETTDETNAKDTFIQLGVNGFATKAKTVEFLKDANASTNLDVTDKAILTVLLTGL